MKLYEYMAKEMFQRHGIPIPPGRSVASPEEAGGVAAELNCPVAVKSQVLSGGRGKAGGIKFAQDPAEAQEVARNLLGSEINGLPVRRVLVEKKLSIDNELYIGLIIDPASRGPLLIASARGGMDIEEVPDRDIFREEVDVKWGLFPYQMRSIASRMGLTGQVGRRLGQVAIALYRLFRAEDATLTEINPLVVSGGDLVAADGRLTFDDDSTFRHPEIPDTEEKSPMEKEIADLGLSYVPLEGDVAIMANGAGATMATMDILEHFGARAMNFLDVGGGAEGSKMTRALELLAETDPAVILINVFGGITRCDEVAHAVGDVHGRGLLGETPLVVRLVGTNEEEGQEILRDAGIAAHSRLRDAAREAADLSGDTIEGGEDFGHSG
ncbi:MAG: ADP-forming succinate--CoA ligase subunit beta [Bacillota bacterium]